MDTAIRRRFAYPAGDIVTGQPRVDRAIDHALWAVRHGRLWRPALGRIDAAVFGFPRSGNTVFAAWLQEVACEGVRIHDGRVTHSALDVHRFAEAAIPVLIPTRPPVDVCASFLVRQGRPTDERLGARLLAAYDAWFAMAQRTLASPHVMAVSFDAITQEPSLVTQWTPMAPLLDADAIAQHTPERFVEQLRQDLGDVIGQGVEQDGVPAAWLISVPDARRADALRAAHRTLGTAPCARDRRRAEDAYASFVEQARAAPCIIELPQRETSDYAQRSA